MKNRISFPSLMASAAMVFGLVFLLTDKIFSGALFLVVGSIWGGASEVVKAIERGNGQ